MPEISGNRLGMCALIRAPIAITLLYEKAKPTPSTLESLAVLHRTGVIFLCKARTRHRLWTAGGILVVAISGTQLLPVAVIAFIAVVGVVQAGLDLYQGKPEVV